MPDYDYNSDPGEFGPRFPRVIDIADGIERDIVIKQELFGEVEHYGTKFDVMRFTLENKTEGGIMVKVLSLGATMQSVLAPDRKGIYKDVILGFDRPEKYYGMCNPGFGRIAALCPLPYSLEKLVWEWDFDHDEGSVTFSTMFYNIDILFTVKYTLTTQNELIMDMKCDGSKIVPVSLTNQVYWNLAGHEKEEESLKHHTLSLNSDRIWKHVSHDHKYIIPVHGTRLDFRTPEFMDSPYLFGEAGFQEVFVVTRGCHQNMTFMARMIHPRSCRYLEVLSDQPWMLCNTLNTLPRFQLNIPFPWPPDEEGEEMGEGDGMSACDVDVEAGGDMDNLSASGLPRQFKEIAGKDGACYRKFSSFNISPMCDLTLIDPIVRAGKPYSHKIIYKLGVYRVFCKPKDEEDEEEDDEEEVN